MKHLQEGGDTRGSEEEEEENEEEEKEEILTPQRTRASRSENARAFIAICYALFP